MSENQDQRKQAPVDRVIDRLAEGGVAEQEQGRFTLDRNAARDKMQQFQLADPHAYVLQLVRAATLKGARKIRFKITADTMRMYFDGKPFTVRDFDGLYNSVFDGRKDEDNLARRHLAIGLNGAEGLRPRSVTVISRGDQGSAMLRSEPGKDDQFGPSEEGPEDEEVVTSIVVRGRHGAGTVGRAVADLAGKLPEEKILRDRCRYSHVEIELEGTILSAGLDLPDARFVVPVEEDTIIGFLGFVPGSDGEGELRVVKDGVWIATHPISQTPPGLLVVAGLPDLTEDLSQSDIIRDKAYERLVAATRRALSDSVLQVIEAFETGPEELHPLLKAALLMYPSMRAFRGVDADPVAERLASLELWDRVGGDRVSLLQLIYGYESRRRFLYCDRSFPELDGAGADFLAGNGLADTVVLGDPAVYAVELSFFRNLFRVTDDVSDRLDALASQRSEGGLDPKYRAEKIAEAKGQARRMLYTVCWLALAGLVMGWGQVAGLLPRFDDFMNLGIAIGWPVVFLIMGVVNVYASAEPLRWRTGQKGVWEEIWVFHVVALVAPVVGILLPLSVCVEEIQEIRKGTFNGEHGEERLPVHYATIAFACGWQPALVGLILAAAL